MTRQSPFSEKYRCRENTLLGTIGQMQDSTRLPGKQTISTKSYPHRQTVTITDKIKKAPDAEAPEARYTQKYSSKLNPTDVSKVHTVRQVCILGEYTETNLLATGFSRSNLQLVEEF